VDWISRFLRTLRFYGEVVNSNERYVMIDAPLGGARVERQRDRRTRVRGGRAERSREALRLPEHQQTPASKAPSRAQATAALNQPANPGAAHYTRQQIDQLTAPIALYPDQLLSQVLMGATYPQQIVDASHWLKDANNAQLKGEALVAALQPLPWDPSVKALVAFPQIIAMMADHIEWTEALGVAFTTQQAEVMERVQALRRLAVKSGRLSKMRHLAVRQEGPMIVIAPSESDRIFVPVYNPVVVYGEWPDRDFPPVFIPPPRDFVLEGIH